MSVAKKFLGGIRDILVALDGEGLRDWLKVEPPLPQEYLDLAAELKSSYQDDDAIEKLVESSLPEDDNVPEGQGTSWFGFNAFIKDYLQYWRDVDFEDLLGAHQLLTALTNSCATALNNPTYGTIMLQTSISLCSSFSTLSMTLNKRPDLTSKLAALNSGDDEQKSFIEITAEIMQKFFTACLTDRSSPRFAPPTGKKIGIYVFANKTLKLLTMNNRSYLATQLLTNLMAKSPPLSYYPASQRVTFLYFLGRFHFNHSLYWRAAQCFQEAYLQTPAHFQKHRRIILTYLIAANFTMGRLPSQSLLQRPEAQSMAQCYSQFSSAIRKGNYIAFQHTIKQHEDWLRSKGYPLFITLQWRIRPLIWRSLSRRTFLLTYTPDEEGDSRKAAVLKLADFQTVLTYTQRRLEGYLPAGPAPKSRNPGNVNSYLLKAVSNSAGPPLKNSTLAPPPGGIKMLMPDEGILTGNMQISDHHVENMVMSLIGQDLLHGYIAHTQSAFAIMGTKQKGSAVAAGWPSAYEIIEGRSTEREIPGWVKDES
ncbi:hypothetical protein F5Y02DRAFT_382852 [Annulohypoxylon stygium]|nr:hypothetical protein F5Y02DRAFT_382852 [Annulohypoxylon stygium]